MSKSCLFEWRHFLPAIILRCVRWYCRYALSYRDVEELTHERDLRVDDSTVYRWVQAYCPQLDKRCRRHLRPTSHSWRVDEVYVQVKGQGRWLYRAVDKHGDTLDFLLTAKRDATAAKRFFRKTLKARNSSTPSVINADKHQAYPLAFAALQQDKTLPQSTELRRNKYINNVIEQDDRFLQRLIKPGLGFKSFNLRWVDSPWLATKINLCGSAFRRKNSVMPRLLAAGIGILALRIFTTARRTLKGYETMNMLRDKCSKYQREMCKLN